MNLADLLLKKEEIPITPEFRFRVPIPPILFDKDIKLDRLLAHKVFPLAVKDFIRDIKNYLEENKVKPSEAKYLKEYLEHQVIENEGAFGAQEYHGLSDTVMKDPSGIAHALDINGDLNVCIEECPFKDWVGFSEEKLKAYSNPRIIGFGHAYVPDNNVGTIDAAFFLRDWAILYVNEALKQANAQKPF